MIIAEYLPVLYRGLLPDFFNNEIEKERIADCKNCIMLKPQKPDKGQQYFSAKTKCCTYFPVIPNYLAGYVLHHKKQTKGHHIMSEIIKNGAGVTPRGVSPGEKYKLLYDMGKKDSFGKAESMKCPFYDSDQGKCLIWDARTSVCSTFFCRYNKGHYGELFWLSIQDYLKKTEELLSEYALYKLNAIPEKTISCKTTELNFNDLDNKPTSKEIKSWNNVAVSKTEFFIKSYKIIRQLTQDDYKKITGFTSEYYLEIIKQTYSELTNENIPDILEFNPENSIFSVNKEEISITTTSGVFRIKRIILDILLLFTGSLSTKEIISELEKKDIILDTELLKSFYHNKILIKK